MIVKFLIVKFLNVPDEDGNLAEPAWEDVDILEIGAVWECRRGCYRGAVQGRGH